MEPRKLTQAKVGLILEQPFFATLMMRKVFIEDASVKTAVTNGNTINYNPDYFDGLSSEELKGVICHLVMHTAMLHHTRREGRDIEQWNRATDYAINPLIIKSGMILPKGYLIDSTYSELPAESIYSLIGEKPKEETTKNPGDKKGAGQGESQQDNDPGGCGAVNDAMPEESRTKQEAEAQQEFAQAIQMAKKQGKLPAFLERLVEEVLEPRVSWKEVLARFISEIAKNDYSFSKPNKRYLHSGFILPSLYNEEVGDIVFLVDTSGSIDEELLNQFTGEMQDIASTFKARIKIIYVDSVVAGTQDIEPDDTFKLEPQGGGGTDFKPGFEYMKENDINPKCAIYFTDGLCSSFPEEPEFPLLWAQTGGRKFKPPFGEVIKLQ